MSARRSEKDSLGEIDVASDAYWGAQTERARRNFPVSGLTFQRRFIAALGLIKGECAAENGARGIVDAALAATIGRAALEVWDGKLDAHFPLDIFQTGSGTSTNMNANEVIANRAIELLGGEIGSKKPVHPNDHVNMGQSSNDVIPTAMHVRRAAKRSTGTLIPALAGLARDARRERRRSSTTSSRSAARTCRTRRRSVSGRSSAATRGRSSSRSRACADAEPRPRGAAARRHGGRHRHQHASRLRRRRRSPH